jgi:hypothetical protein
VGFTYTIAGVNLLLAAVIWQIRIISAEPMKISGATDTVQLRLIIGIFCGSFPVQFLIKNFCSAGRSFLLKNQPHSMSSDAGASVLDEALACIGRRIASILVQPTNKDKNYIASLRNEVVGIS